jgi:phosphoribosylanthranilate isomerase
MTYIKICGIRDKSHALAAIEAGVDFIGLVFAASKRQVTPTEASKIITAVKKNSATLRAQPSKRGGMEEISKNFNYFAAKPQIVGVFVNAPASMVNEIADFCALDWVQLSGDESWEYCREINKPIIKAIRISPQYHNVIQSPSLPVIPAFAGISPRVNSAESLNAELSAGSKLLSAQRFIPLLDSQVEGQYGGTGSTFNWNIARQVAKRFPVIIAGGLNPENVAQVIEAVAPWGVDVSSGVEVEGVKDVAKIRAFIEAVRKVDAAHTITVSRSPEPFAPCHSRPFFSCHSRPFFSCHSRESGNLAQSKPCSERIESIRKGEARQSK